MIVSLIAFSPEIRSSVRRRCPPREIAAEASESKPPASRAEHPLRFSDTRYGQYAAMTSQVVFVAALNPFKDSFCREGERISRWCNERVVNPEQPWRLREVS